MKREYVKPSMAMSLFNASDVTNVTTASSVGVKGIAGRAFDRTGITIIDGGRYLRS